jgi:hypothetical protein
MFILPFCQPAGPRHATATRAAFSIKYRNMTTQYGKFWTEPSKMLWLRFEVVLMEDDGVIDASHIWWFCGGP